MGSLSILFRQCSYPVVLMKMIAESQVNLSSFFFFSGGFNSSFLCWSYIFFLVSNTFSCRCFLYPSMSLYSIVPECSRYLEDLCFHSAFVQALSRMLSHSSHLIQPVQSLFKIVQRCIFWVGPNPQVFSQDLTWLFYFSGAIQISFRSLT